MSANYDPRKWRQQRLSGAMPKSSPGFHCASGKESACGHVGEGILEPLEFVGKPEVECCPACWRFAEASKLFPGAVEKTKCYEPLHIPRTLHARDTTPARRRP